MPSIPANLDKLRRLQRDDWRIESITSQCHGSSWTSTVVLKHGEKELTLKSDDQDFTRACLATKQFFDVDGIRMFREVADLGRYNTELLPLTIGFEEETRKAFERIQAGQIRLTFDPSALIREFLRSRAWGDSRFVPLKAQYFDVLAVVFVMSKKIAEAEARLYQLYPEAGRYAKRITEILLKSFDPLNEPLRNYLRFSDLNGKDFGELSKKVINEAALNNDMHGRLAKDGPVEGQIGLRYLIDMYRRYAEAILPLLKILSEAVAIADGQSMPDPFLGMTKRVELIRHSAYADVVDCLDPRIRHAASHSAISYDQSRGIVKLEGAATEGFDDFEMTYTEVADICRFFTRGFVPGIVGTIGMYQELQLAAMVQSGDYRRLLLLIDNEAPRL